MGVDWSRYQSVRNARITIVTMLVTNTQSLFPLEHGRDVLTSTSSHDKSTDDLLSYQQVGTRSASNPMPCIGTFSPVWDLM
jgi:hypothetical protein